MWKKKHASKRVKSLLERNSFHMITHFYDDIVYMNWKKQNQNI